MSLKIKISILAICFALLAAVCVGFAFAAQNEKLNLKGTLSYEVAKATISVSPNISTLGSTTGSGSTTGISPEAGSGEYAIGETVTLTATPSGSNKFLAWATSTDTNEMEILSISPTYSFKLSSDSPTTYFALFNSTETEHTDAVGDLTYILYNEAKLAEVTDTTLTTLSSVGIPAFVQNDSSNQSFRVYSIGTNAFADCSKLTEIIIPEGVAKIGAMAFFNCANLSSVTLPKSLISFESISTLPGEPSISAPFAGSIVKIFKGEGNDYYSIDDGRAIITDGGKTLFAYAAGNELASYQIPDGVTSIAAAFMACHNLTSVSLPNSLTSIGAWAFQGCINLTKITIPEGVTSIGARAFVACSNLTTVNLPSTLTLIGDYAFYQCESLTSINFPDGVRSIGQSAFSGCSGLTSVSLPSTLTKIGEWAFRYCSSLTSITINGNISTFGPDPFLYSDKLTSLTLGAEVSELPDNLFTGNNLIKLTEIVVEEESTLKNVALPTYGTWYKDGEEVSEFIGAGTYVRLAIKAQANNSNLGSVSGGGEFGIGDIVTLTATASSSSNSTFIAWATSKDPETMQIVSTSETYSFELSSGSPRTYYALFNSTETGQTVGDLEYTFYNEAKLAMITGRTDSFPSEVKEFTIPSVVSDGENSYKVFIIGPSAFFGCRNLTSITIPEGVTSIGDYAFNNCSGLTEITLPSTLTSIGAWAFQYCSSLTSVSLPSTLTEIGSVAFYGCTSLTEITIPESVTSIGFSAFQACEGLTSITIPDGVTAIGDSAFSGCKSLTSVTLPSTLTEIGEEAFLGCSSLTEITINGNITSLGYNAFSNCSSLKKLRLGKDVSTLPDNLFTNSKLTKLTEIVVLGDLTSTTFPSGTWYKNNDPTPVRSFSGAGTYSTTKPA